MPHGAPMGHILLNSIQVWSRNNLDVVYFIYGIAFSIMGFTILIQPKKGSRYRLGGVLWLLAGFGLVHGLNEFLDMWAIIKNDEIAPTAVHGIVLIISYLFLFEFGRKLFIISLPDNPVTTRRARSPWWLFSLACAVFLLASMASDFWLSGRIWARYLIGFPGAVLTSIGLLFFYRTNEIEFDLLRVKRYFYMASACFLAYGALGGLVVPRGDVLLSQIINNDAFLSAVHLPVQVFRALCALGIARSVYGIIRIFHWENVEKLRRTSDDLRMEFEAGKEKVLEIKRLLATKTQFISMVSHELRTPLTAIKANIDIVLKGRAGELSAGQKTFLDVAGDNVNRLSRLINDVLGFQTLTSGKVKYEFGEFDVNEVIGAAGNIMLPLARAKNIVFQLKREEGLPKARMDHDKIIQVLDNLIINAIRHTKKGGITVSSKRTGAFIEVVIEDTGSGIRAEDVPKLFEPFTQIRNKKGTGLGLAICREIINEHDGRIWAESEFGKGSRFHFVLPVAERREHGERAHTFN